MSLGSDVPDDASGPDNIVTNVILATVLAPFFALVFVCLRFYTSRNILRTIYKDDWLILIGLVRHRTCEIRPKRPTDLPGFQILSIAYSISLIVATRYGLGYHLLWLIQPARGWGGKDVVLITGFPAAITNNLATLFTKASILVFYLRFSTSRFFSIAVYSVLFVVVFANFLGAIGTLIACRPMAAFWDREVAKRGTCFNRDAWYAWLIILNCVTDGILLVLPAWLLAPLRIGFAQKLALGTILGTGGFVLGVSIFRVIVVSQGWGHNDYTYRFAVNYIWSVIETNVAIICACAPTLRALCGRFIPSLLQLNGRRDPMALYTIPVSQLANRRPPTPAHVEDVSGSSTQLTSNHGTKLFGSDRASSRGRDQHIPV
ncbi:hypothetical protein QBC35DRAFT_139964 [Podospora australis]|uniref:Rhodopsin domain-containing protein n=1 Tax=Podospora australis TaxID=1536484 RepID=A0AAN7ABU8_9PEZI|nr:hypothetical protein QBC35DRAFT_139964 [Podospora australis]